MSRTAACTTTAIILLRQGTSARWEMLASLISMHKNGSCICSKKIGAGECPTSKYLKGAWDISEFFHLEKRKEAV